MTGTGLVLGAMGGKVAEGGRLLLRPFEALAAARADLFLFLPVFMATGIGLWFRLPTEPGQGVYAALGAAGLGLALLAWRGPWALRPPAVALAAVMVGALACGLRVWMVASPMLAAPYYGPIQGRIIDIDRSQTDAVRLTLDQVVLSEIPPDQTPATIRISLRGEVKTYQPGATVLTTARIAAPEAASEPDGFDFRRMAWFQQLGAVGYTPNPVVIWAEPGPYEAWINRIRAYLSQAITDRVPGDAGAFASGSLTGDRSGISAQVVADLRNSSLAHLLAISGMNMAFIVAFVFGLVRYGLALVPVLALRIEAKKIAAVIAFFVAAFYLALSGANVATARAFLTVSIMLGAVLLDRRAITLRSVAISALALMLWAPESLLEPGFQMSYAATIALIAGFSPVERWMKAKKLPWIAEAVGLLVATSVLAGVATAPYAAATFNRTAPWGLVANLMTVPVMSLVMGGGAVALVLAPVGLAGPALWVMGKASAWILFVAHWVSGWGGAVTPVPQPGPWVIPLMTLGGLWLVIWAGRGKLWGLAPIAMGLVLWGLVERPVLLISSDGVLAGVMGPEGRALSSSRGAGFAAEAWLSDDGDLADPKAAALRPGMEGAKSQDRSFAVAGLKGVILQGKGAADRVAAACKAADLVILPLSFGPAPVQGPCRMVDATLLARSGALGSRVVPGGLVLIPVRAQARVWTGNDRPVEDVLVTKVAP